MLVHGLERERFMETLNNNAIDEERKYIKQSIRYKRGIWPDRLLLVFKQRDNPIVYTGESIWT